MARDELDPIVRAAENRIRRLRAEAERREVEHSKARGGARREAERPERTSKRETLQGRDVSLPELDPWEEEVDGAELLYSIVRELRRFVVMPAEEANAVALWVIHTHAIPAADYSPILTISSPVKGCGKTTLQQRLVRRLVPRPLPSCDMSGPALFRLIEATGGTVLLDEFDSLGQEARDALRNLLNAGVGRDDAFVFRLVGDQHVPRRFAVFGPKSLALNGRVAETVEDRSILIHLERAKKGEIRERLRRRQADALLTPLARKAARWAEDHREVLRDREPEIPESLNDRACDLWEPLLAIADEAGGGWPERARLAAVKLAGGRTEERGTKEQLLADIAGIFESQKPESGRLPSADLVAALNEMEGRPWAEWNKGRAMTANSLARLLSGFNVRPGNVRVGGQVFRGYEQADFTEAFARYLARSGSESACVAVDVAVQNGGFGAPVRHCSGVAVETHPQGEGGAE